MINDTQILIRAPFSEQYTIIIDSDLIAVDMAVTSTVQMRYDFHVLSAGAETIEIRLVQLDNVLLNANNPLVQEVAQVSQIFGRMYNELHLLLDHKGTVLKVLNNDFILSKWRQTKAEMEKHIDANDNLRYAITLNDAIFTDPEKIKVAVQANEFLRCYFGQVFGVNLPQKTVSGGTNIFNTVNMEWSIDINTSVSLPANTQSLTVSTTAQPKLPVTLEFSKEAYSQFADKIVMDDLHPRLLQQETRIIEYANGRIQEAEISKTEIADDKRLYNKLRYTLKSDRGIIIGNSDNDQERVTTEDTTSKFKFFDIG